MMEQERRQPGVCLSLVPLCVLVCMVCMSIVFFGSDALNGANQISLLMATAVCACLGKIMLHVRWRDMEAAIVRTLGGSSISIVILLLIGMMSSAWMISGTVPTLIYYGVQMMSPMFFLFMACIICAMVSLVTGSSWTTIATIGIALLGIGEALSVPEAWTAGTIISGAYFGDKISPVSDTTVLASTAARVNIFDHIRFMMGTTVPTFIITLLIFLVAGFCVIGEGPASAEIFTEGLSRTFNISLWTLLVPLFTGILIARKVPALVTLFLSGLAAGIMAAILQPEIVAGISGESGMTARTLIKGVMTTWIAETHVDAGNEALNSLIDTSGMAGMLKTVWLILSAMCFGGVMTETGMLQSITQSVASMVRGRTSLVSCTAVTGFSLNMMTSDQYMSIVLTADMYRDVYHAKGEDGLLLSRTTEDSTTVTSVLIPWNTCGMTQATVLGVPTLSYLPFCFFNYLSPLMTIAMSMRKGRH